ncbi:beta/gamma crystallin-related protein [Ulvibacter litoralis]|uniref:Beta/Gamma crystallin n=1 Tax=Ulvibacter litoralis TaxID=227084 RepID=A0A1G7DER9_9FLAO|nr:beta/gamma crystallin-related protein [Ulvibacter litoralis]GHC43720.1 hypothetical protein GCM10008083_02720 [Ulvibacter litoralis]SDE50042.1 Beta/Gamma crystallin [Ulvibacter litoralis]
MKTLAKKHQKTETPPYVIVKGLLLFLFCIVSISNVNAQKTIFGPILNSNPHNNNLKEVTLFEHDNFNEYFNGAKKVITQNMPNLSNMNNRTTGIAVPLGRKVILYETEGYQGRKITLYPGNYSHLNGWNDLASAIKIETIPFDEPVAYFLNDTGNIYTNQVFQGFGAEKVDNNSMVCYDCFSKLIVIGSLNVIAYDHADWGGRSNEDNPFKEGTYNLVDWGLDNNISSLEILNFKYALSKTVLKNPRVLSKDVEKTIAVAATGTNTNVNGAPKMEGTVSGCFEASATQSFDAATTIGISTAVRSSVSVGVEGVASASIEFELAAKLETTLTSGNSTTVTEQQCWEIKREVPVPKGCEGKITLIATPEVQVWKIEKHYIPVDSKGDPVPSGIPKIVTGTLKVTKGIGATTNISLNNDCNQGNTNPGDDTSSTTQQSSPPNSGLGSISEIEFCDQNGTVVGFYTNKSGTWEEYDDNGTSRFMYQEMKRDNNAIYLSDLNRAGVKIILNLNTKEVLYGDNNNTTPFKLYTISNAL